MRGWGRAATYIPWDLGIGGRVRCCEELVAILAEGCEELGHAGGSYSFVINNCSRVGLRRGAKTVFCEMVVVGSRIVLGREDLKTVGAVNIARRDLDTFSAFEEDSVRCLFGRRGRSFLGRDERDG